MVEAPQIENLQFREHFKASQRYKHGTGLYLWLPFGGDRQGRFLLPRLLQPEICVCSYAHYSLFFPKSLRFVGFF